MRKRCVSGYHSTDDVLLLSWEEEGTMILQQCFVMWTLRHDLYNVMKMKERRKRR